MSLFSIQSTIDKGYPHPPALFRRDTPDASTASELASDVSNSTEAPPALPRGTSNYMYDHVPSTELFIEEETDVTFMQLKDLEGEWIYTNREILYMPVASVIRSNPYFRKLAEIIGRGDLIFLLDSSVEIINRFNKNREVPLE